MNLFEEGIVPSGSTGDWLLLVIYCDNVLLAATSSVTKHEYNYISMF